MSPGKRKRILVTLAILLAGLSLLLVALPGWFPWVLRPAARSQGVTYGAYQRVGFKRFVISDVTYTNPGVALKAQHLDLLLPHVWLWRLATGSRPGEQAFVRGSGVSLISIPRSQPGAAAREPPPEPVSVTSESLKAHRALQGLARWLPSAVVSNGTLRIGESPIRFPELIWSNGTISAIARFPRVAGPVALTARGTGPGAYAVHVRSEPMKLVSAIRLFTNEVGAALQSTNFWHGSRIEAQAQFGPGGTLPSTGSVVATELNLPAAALGLPYYSNLLGSVSATWQASGYSIDLRAAAESPSGTRTFPPLQLNLHARGDTSTATLETATLVSPALKVALSREATLHFTGRMVREPVGFSLDADFSRQDFLPVRGRATGQADLSPGAGRYPDARFHLEAQEVEYELVRAKSVEVEGRFAWPRLEIARALARVDDGSVSVSGTVDLSEKRIAEGEVRITGKPAGDWLPEGCSLAGLGLEARVSGPIERLMHSGDLAVTNASTPLLSPLDVRGRWSGAHTTLDRLQLTFSNRTDLLRLDCAVAVSSNKVDLRLAKAGFETNGYPCLSLANPVEASASREGAGRPWKFESSSLELAGEGGRLSVEGSVEWPRQADLRIAIRQLSSRLFAGLVSRSIPDLELSSIAARAAWTNGPASFDLLVSGNVETPEKLRATPRIAVDLSAAGGRDGLVISNLTISGQTSTVAHLEGELPVSFWPARRTNLLQWDTRAPLRLQALTDSRSAHWDILSRYTGVGLREPRLEATLSGSWAAPEGLIKAGASALVLSSKTNRPSPNIDNLELTLAFDRGQARLTTGRLQVQGQPVTFKAQMPLEQDFWPSLMRGRWPNLDAASGRMQVENADVAAFQPLLPTLLAPQGALNLDLALHPGRHLEGQLTVEDARTQPLDPAGPVRNIFAQLRLEERTLRIQKVSANLGEATLNLTGSADLSGGDWLRGEWPPLNLSLQGLGVPLARQPEFVLRSDLLLGVVKTNGAPPLITGTVRLHDSYYLSDLRDLVPGGVASPERRPPFFSIREPLLADWRLAVDVSGTEFLKLRSPIFNGAITANLKLQGTLKDPIALGDIRMDSGVVRFPFASLQLQQGLVSLTSQDPYHPQLSVAAASKQYGYDIRMHVSGPVDAPIIQFSSTPPLSSEQILLMVSAGELPRGTLNLTPQQRAQTVAMFLGRDLLSQVGVGDDTQQRLSIRSGEQISEQGRPTYRVEYKLSERWSLTGEYDRFGDFNAGFKWHVYSK